MARTVKNLFLEIDELQQRHRVWEEIKSFLERHSKSTVDGSAVNEIKMHDGRHVDPEVVLNMLLDVDETMGTIEARIGELEVTEVGGGKSVSRKAAGNSRGGDAKPRKGSRRTGKADGKARGKG